MRLKPRIFRKPQLSHILARGLVGYWLHNEHSGLITNDLSRNGNYGAITGATWMGDGLDFVPSNNDYVQTNNVVDPDATVGTVIVRFRADTLHQGTLFHTADLSTGNVYGILMRVSPSGFGEVLIRISDVNFAIIQDTDNVIYAAGQWVTVAVVQDGTGYVYYADGIPQAMSDFAASSSDLTAWNATVAGLDRTRIGREADLTDSNTFDGIISDVSSYNRALSASEILQLYRNQYILFDRSHVPLWQSQIAAGANPKGPLTHPLYGPFAGPIAC